jgi:hypothetical protein
MGVSNMKKCLLVLFVVQLFLISSCVPYEPLPEGVWKSEEPRIILYIEPDYQIRGSIFPGLFTIDDSESKILIRAENDSSFTISTPYALMEGGGFNGNSEVLVFRGSFRTVSNELRLTPEARDSQSTGHNLIVFHRIEEYDLINIKDWGQHLENPDIWFN